MEKQYPYKKECTEQIQEYVIKLFNATEPWTYTVIFRMYDWSLYERNLRLVKCKSLHANRNQEVKMGFVDFKVPNKLKSTY